MSPTETLAIWAFCGNLWTGRRKLLVVSSSLIGIWYYCPWGRSCLEEAMMKGDGFLPLMSLYHKNAWVYCHRVNNSCKTTPISFLMCAAAAQGAFPCSWVCAGIVLVEGVVLIMDAAHWGVLVMNLGLERRRQDFINEIRLGSMSSNDLISRASSV